MYFCCELVNKPMTFEITAVLNFDGDYVLVDFILALLQYHSRFNGMNLHQFCVLKEYPRGNWSRLLQIQLPQLLNRHKGINEHDHLFYHLRLQIFLCWVLIALYTVSLFWFISSSVTKLLFVMFSKTFSFPKAENSTTHVLLHAL